MNKPDRIQVLRETALKRPLTDSERAELKSSLTATDESKWATEAEELALTEVLSRLPSAPAVSSNFTTLVLQKIALEEKAAERIRSSGRSSAWLRRWFIPLAGTALILISSFVAFHGWEERKLQIDLARNVNELGASVTADDLKLMRDYEPIRRMSDSQQPKADVELLALLK